MCCTRSYIVQYTHLVTTKYSNSVLVPVLSLLSVSGITPVSSHHFVRERITDGTILVPHCSSEENAADILTKALPRLKHAEQLALINLATR